ncbi:hypothetical protein NDU88_001335 [Pleurodeles waltl]|uniref:Uncharacterized protein n=1 Tax=Pleurodeles waltl TaxID=8319 RepID=A0AAV7KSN6_PLEWA|nr:hypothetical protein NDU88_001335 [Pleurodeles waltl]
MAADGPLEPAAESRKGPVGFRGAQRPLAARAHGQDLAPLLGLQEISASSAVLGVHQNKDKLFKLRNNMNA